MLISYLPYFTPFVYLDQSPFSLNTQNNRMNEWMDSIVMAEICPLELIEFQHIVVASTLNYTTMYTFEP